MLQKGLLTAFDQRGPKHARQRGRSYGDLPGVPPSCAAPQSRCSPIIMGSPWHHEPCTHHLGRLLPPAWRSGAYAGWPSPRPFPRTRAPCPWTTRAKGDPRKLLAGPAKASAPPPRYGTERDVGGAHQTHRCRSAQNPEDKDGVALVSVDGKPPRALHVGDVVDAPHVIKRLTQRGAEIGPADGPTAVTLDLPTLPPPATGMLPLWLA